jgi:hypothetical protein
MLATSAEREQKPFVQDQKKGPQQAGSARHNDLRSNAERQARVWRNLGKFVAGVAAYEQHRRRHHQPVRATRGRR